ncbi:hypothetical protein U1Q18_001596 [Sarracenia purpurea var. burkii]
MGSTNRFSVLQGTDEDFLDSVKGTSFKISKPWRNADAIEGIFQESESLRDEVKRALSGSNPFNLTKMAALETHIQ